MASLNGAWTKVRRAEHHLDQLKMAIVSLLQPNPERLLGHLDPNASQWIYPARRSPSTRTAWSALVGDILSNYRSALDYLVAELVMQGGGTVTTRTGLPIVDNPTKWADSSREKIAGVVAGSESVIRAIQPCDSGNPAQLHPLSMLRDLNNWDKHQAIHTTTQVATGRFESGGSYRGISPTSNESILSGPFQRNEPLATVEMTFWPDDAIGWTPGDELMFYRPLVVTHDIAFQGGPPFTQGRSVIETLEDIATCVEESLARFEQFF